jgi:hypothetical protein
MNPLSFKLLPTRAIRSTQLALMRIVVQGAFSLGSRLFEKPVWQNGSILGIEP